MAKIKKNILVFILSVATLFNVFALAACSSSTKADPNAVFDANADIAGETINVFLFGQSHEVEAYERLIREFEDATYCNVNFEIEADNYFDLLSTSLIGKSPPDVFYVRPGDVRRFANQNHLVNLTKSTGVLEEEVADIWEQAIDFFRFDKASGTNNTGDIYALPKDYSQYILGFNKLLIYDRVKVGNDYQYTLKTKIAERLAPFVWNGTQADSYEEWEGVNISVNTSAGDVVNTQKIKLPGMPGEKDDQGNDLVFTYDEFGAMAYLMSDNGQWTLNPDMSPSSKVYGTAFWESMCLMAYVWGSEGEFLRDNFTKVNTNSDNFVEGYQGFLDLNNKWFAHAIGASNTGYELFVDGKLLFYPVGTWDIAYFSRSEFASKLEYDIMPWPISNRYANTSMSERQDKWKARVDSVGYGISAKSKKKSAAAQFIKFLSINEDIQRRLAQEGLQIPNIESMAKGEYLDGTLKGLDGKDIAPKNKQLLLNVAAGVEKNGHFGPTVYTYNDEWFTEFFSGTSVLWKTPPEQLTLDALKSYCNEYTAKAQSRLNDAIELEREQMR